MSGRPSDQPWAASEPAADPVGTPPREPAVEPDAGHGVKPLRDLPTGGRAHRARRPLAMLLAVLVLVALGGVWLVARPSEVAGKATAATPAASVPPGFAPHRGNGFTIAIPRGWFKDPSEQEIFWVSDPHSPRLVLAHVEWWEDAAPGGAYSELTGLERGDFLDANFITKYRRIKLAKLPAPRGTTRAELEVAYHVNEDGGYDLHERLRAFVTATGRTYILTISSQGDNHAQAEQLWRTEQDDLTTILDSFRLSS
jgi:hypothetical protein